MINSTNLVHLMTK